MSKTLIFGVVFIGLFLASPTHAQRSSRVHNASETQFEQMKRDAAKRQQKKQQQAEAQHREKMAAENRLFAEQARRERKQLFETNPQAYFTQYVDGRIFVDDAGNVVKPEQVRGTVTQVLDEQSLLVRANGETIAVFNFPTAGYFDNARFDENLIPAGTFQYLTVLGAGSTVRKLVPPKPISYSDFIRQFDFIRADSYIYR